MRTVNQNSKLRCLLAIGLISIMLLPGCTNWKKRYEYLNVEHQNLKGRYEHLLAQRDQLSEQVSEGQMTISELEKKIAERRTGFEEVGDVTYDPTKGTITVTLPNTILFDSGKATLKRATSVELDHIQSVLQSQHAGRQVDVVGHTDTDPIKVTKDKWKDNLELSSQRALTVVRYLIKRGIPEDRIRAVGCGASQPIASNATASGKARNRRVEIVVYLK